METSTPIPILLCGKIPGHILATTDIVKPEYRVLKACPTVEDARETVASLLSPATETPTIDGIEYPRPRLVIMGGGFTPDDFMSVYETVDGAKSVPWVRPASSKPGSGRPPAAPPPADVVALKVRSALDEHRAEIDESKGAGEIWWM